MKTIFFFAVVGVTLVFLTIALRRRPLRQYGSVDAIVPAFNEEPCIEASIRQLLKNPYFRRVIVVNDGSTDGTQAILDRLAAELPLLVVVHQANTGKGGALMNGLSHAEAEFIFLTDADTWVPSEGNGIGYMLEEMERGADAVGGIPSSNLKNAGLLPHVRASVKLPMIILKRSFQQILGGAPFVISGACGLFRREVLLAVPFSDRTNVEDLDMTWALVSKGYRVRQCCTSFVYSQECNSVRSEWQRWRRWITGYAVCMRLYPGLMLTRYGLFTILPMFFLVAVGILGYASQLLALASGTSNWALAAMCLPVLWVAIVACIAVLSALHHRRWRLVLLAPAAVLYVFLAYWIWVVHGLAGLMTGREPARDKPVRYAHVVG